MWNRLLVLRMNRPIPKIEMVVDVEADGDPVAIHSMVSFGVVIVEEKLDRVFYGQTKPISQNYNPKCYELLGITREIHESYEHPSVVMQRFREWLINQCDPSYRLTLWSDNPAFDWQFFNYYLHKYTGNNPFGHSCRRIGDLYSGVIGKPNNHSSWKRLRRTNHDHNPVNDAIGNAEALLQIKRMVGGKR